MGVPLMRRADGLGAGCWRRDWLAVDNLNVFYRICDNAGDDLVYMALE